MKKILISSIVFLLFSSMFAQVPQKMSYQAVVRNSNGTLVASANIGLRISILKGSITGNAVYEETHATATNQNGLVSIEVGNGIPQKGLFSDINWSNDSYFIKTETDPNGGSNYTISGTSQLLSVPYALYAENTKNLGKSTIYLRGDITDQQASDLLEKFSGPNTENVYITDTTVLTNVDLSKATSLVKLTINNNASLTSVKGNKIEAIFDEVSITYNPKLTTLTFNSLADIYLLRLEENKSISQIILPNLLNGSVSISQNNLLTTIDLPNLIKGSFNIDQNESLTTINLPNYNNGNIYIYSNNNLTSINCPNYTTGEQVIYYNAILSSINFANYTSGKSRFMNNSSLNSINLPNFAEGDIKIESNSSLNSFSLPNYKKGEFTIGDNSSLTSVALPSYYSGLPTSTTYAQTITNNPLLTTIVLTSFNLGNITIKNNNLLATFNLPSFNNGSILLFSNTNLVNTSFPNFTDGVFELRDCNSIQQVNFPNLTTGRLQILYNSSLNSVTFPNLTNLKFGDNIGFYNNNLSSSMVNSILNKMLTVLPASGKNIRLDGQKPVAPPTGQGIIDKQTLISNGNNVQTD